MKRLLAAALALGFVLLPSSAHAVPPAGGSINGTVTDAVASTPLQGICVGVFPETSRGEGDPLWTAESTSTGSYSINGVSSGSYLVRFSDCTGRGYAEQWWNGKSDPYSADTVTVTAPLPSSGIDAAMAPGAPTGSISGTIRDAHGDPLQVCVSVYGKGIATVDVGYSGAEGRYSVTGLPTGSYYVELGYCDPSSPDSNGFVQSESQPGYLPCDYNAAHDCNGAFDEVQVLAPNDTSGIDGVLAAASGISGHVTDGVGEPLAGICLALDDGDRSYDGATGADGTYTIVGLEPGDYLVDFYDCDQHLWKAQYYDNAASGKDATRVHTTGGAITTGIDAVLLKRPRPDLAVTAISIRDIPLSIDRGPLLYPGMEREVNVTVENKGNAASTYAWPQDAYIQVWAATSSDGGTQHIGTAGMDLAPGASTTMTFPWHGEGSVGDATVNAETCNLDDSDPSNNLKQQRHYVLLGGTGAGATLAGSPEFDCETGPVPQ